jgi:hypothetical protein
MTSLTASPQAAIDGSFGEVSTFTRPPSNIHPTMTTTIMEKNTAPEAFHCTTDTSNGHFTSTNANPTNLNTTTDSYVSIAPATDALSPPPTDAAPLPLPSYGTLRSVRGQPSHWTEEEEKRLAIAVVTCGEKNWDTIAMMMPGRTKASCRRKWILSANGWTLKEDIPLQEAVETCGVGNWDEIAARMPGHSALACQKRWAIIAESYNNRSTNKTNERLPWTDEQEKRLVQAVNTCGIGEWAVVGALVPGRSGLACREKWKRMTGQWSLEEDLELVMATKVCGEGNWKEIASMIPKRTQRQCRFRSSTILRDAPRNTTSQVFGTDETETTPNQTAKTRNAGGSDGVAGTYSRQPRMDKEEKKRIQVANTCDPVVETVPGRTDAACSGQSWPWTDVETKKLVDAVKTYGEWDEWAAIAAMVPNRSEAECRLKWTSATPVWTPQEDMLLAVAVKACDEGVWLQVAARVPGRTRLDCFNRWNTLAEASRTFIEGLPQMNGGVSSPVGVVATCGEANGATIATEVTGWSDIQRRIKRQRLYPSVTAVLNQPKSLPVNMTAARTPPFPSVNEVTRVPCQFPLPGQSNLQFQFHSKQQHLYPPPAGLLNQPKGIPIHVTAAMSPPSPLVNGGTAWVPYQLPPREVAPIFQPTPSIYDFPPMLFTRHHY